MRCSKFHEELDETGQGRCSVPMWQMGCECFCDDPAYGKRPETNEYWTNAYTGERMRHDGLYAGYVPALACHAHGGPKSRVFKDGNMWCAVFKEFINLQESRAGFGETPEQARQALEKATP